MANKKISQLTGQSAVNVDVDNDVVAIVDLSGNETKKIVISDLFSAAGTTDKNYVHNQISSSPSWVVTHNLNKFPSVSIVDSGGTVVIGDIQHDSVNQATLTFSAPFSGKAYFN